MNIENYINGEMRASHSGAVLDNYNPASGKVYGTIPNSDAKDVAEAYAAAAAAFAAVGLNALSPSSAPAAESAAAPAAATRAAAEAAAEAAAALVAFRGCGQNEAASKPQESLHSMLSMRIRIGAA